MDRLFDCVKWVFLTVVLGLSGCVRPPSPESIRIIATPQIAGCGEYALEMALDLHIQNLGSPTLRFDVASGVRDPPVLSLSAYSVLDVSHGGSVLDKRLTPVALIPVVEIADHAKILGRDDGEVIALLYEVRPEDYAKTLRIELHDQDEHPYLSEPFTLCAPKTSPTDIEATLPLTPRSARLLRLPALARLLLGSEGARVVDARRLRYLASSGEVTLYERAAADVAEPAICRAQRVDISLNEKGNIDSRTRSWRFGAPGDLYRGPAMRPSSSDRSRCAMHATPRYFFPAPDGRAAAQMARYMEVFNGHGPFANPTITAHWGETHRSGRLPRGTLADIDGVDAIACLPDHPDENACFRVQDNDRAREYRVCGVNRWDNVRIDKVEGSWATVLY